MQEAKENHTPEQAADLAALTAASQSGEAAATGQAAQQQVQAAPQQLAEEIAGVIAMAVATFGPMFPSLKETYTPEITGAAAGAIAAVCKKHGWMSGGMFSEYGEEVACLAIVGPLAYSTYVGIKGDMAAKQATQVPKVTKSEATPLQQSQGAKGVTIGAVQQ